MEKQFFTFSLNVEVFDTEALARAAERRAVESGMSVEDWREMRLDNGYDDGGVHADLIMLFDPGTSPDGCEIQDSTVEQDVI